MSTTRKTSLKVVEPGHYFHFGVQEGVQSMLRKLGIKGIHGKKIKLLINVDGIPISKSSGSQFWPVLGYLVDYPYSEPFLIGIYHGYSKPSDANDFLLEFTIEMTELYDSGFFYNEDVCHIEIFGFVCDAPARAFITFTKTHSGYASCSKCIEEGEWDGRIIFLKEDAALRDDTSFRSKCQEDYHTGTSVLEKLPIDMVKSFPLDYMHLVCLGVMRKLLWAWIKGSYKASRLRGSDIDEISQYLIFVSAFIACEFSRKSRSLKELARWKATELRLFLLYIGPVV